MKRRAFVGGALGGVAAAVGWQRFRQAGVATIPEFGRLSFSQQGEDLVLFHALHDQLRIERPTYMDVGAAHPVQSNNTYLLYGTGCHGLLVEPNPMFVELLRRQRPKDTVLAAGIGIADAADAEYFEVKENPLLNTFSREQVAYLQEGRAENVVSRVTRMPLVNINRAIAEHLGKAPDLLSTDVEGLDAAIIRTLDLSTFRPGVICCEGVSYYKGGSQSDAALYLIQNGYIMRGGSMVNSVFVDGTRVEA